MEKNKERPKSLGALLQKEKAQSYFDGAEMAFNDCADMVDELADNLPADIKFMAGSVKLIATNIRKKCQNMKEIVNSKPGVA